MRRFPARWTRTCFTTTALDLTKSNPQSLNTLVALGQMFMAAPTSLANVDRSNTYTMRMSALVFSLNIGSWALPLFLRQIRLASWQLTSTR